LQVIALDIEELQDLQDLPLQRDRRLRAVGQLFQPRAQNVEAAIVEKNVLDRQLSVNRKKIDEPVKVCGTPALGF